MYKELPHKPTIFFCGDGVSDLSAAKAADLLFVKVIPGCVVVLFLSSVIPPRPSFPALLPFFLPCFSYRPSFASAASPLSPSFPYYVLTLNLSTRHTNDLMVHCLREKIPFVPFEDFVKVKEVVASVVKGGRSIADVLAEAASEQKQ
jgi:hypothetical protein